MPVIDDHQFEQNDVTADDVIEIVQIVKAVGSGPVVIACIMATTFFECTVVCCIARLGFE